MVQERVIEWREGSNGKRVRKRTSEGHARKGKEMQEKGREGESRKGEACNANVRPCRPDAWEDETREREAIEMRLRRRDGRGWIESRDPGGTLLFRGRLEDVGV